VSLSAWFHIGLLLVAADVVYFVWMMARTGKPPKGGWAQINLFLYWGGALVFVVILSASLLIWHANALS
jgi:hypothetical protein